MISFKLLRCPRALEKDFKPRVPNAFVPGSPPSRSII